MDDPSFSSRPGWAPGTQELPHDMPAGVLSAQELR
jgi:hypothetical protein